MEELFVTLLLLIFVLTFFALFLLRADWKDLQKGKDRLYSAWSEYYAETRKYKELESVIVRLKSGQTIVVEGVKQWEERGGKRLVVLYDVYGTAVKAIDSQEILEITFNRGDFVEGSRNLFDED